MNDFYEGETKRFTVTITYGGSVADITNDVVTIYFKSKKSVDDVYAEIIKEADVTTSGSDGIAVFYLRTSDTSVTPGLYYYEIIWETQGGDKYILFDNSTVKIKPRLTEV